MKCVRILIEMENDAFQPEPHHEVSRILHELANNIVRNENMEQPIRDINGNKVGRVRILACKHDE